MPDATALSTAIVTGRVTCRAAMAACLDAIAANENLGAVARLLPAEIALAMAEKRDLTLPDAPEDLHGVPILAKDLGSQAQGLGIGAGIAAIRERARDPARHSPFFARLTDRGGMIPFGLTTVPPMGLAVTSDPAANPFDRRLTAGGSSGGAAAAVAGGLVPIAHATDAAGSIRVPAASCGLWGLKPSRGATPMGPGFENYLGGHQRRGRAGAQPARCRGKASASPRARRAGRMRMQALSPRSIPR